MIDIHTLKKHDSTEMYKVYDRWPQIAKDSYQKELEPIDFGGISHIVFAGMGGSGALGDIFAAILSKSFIPVTLVKGYTLPKTVNSSTLVVATSVSGNTEETNIVLDSAKKITENFHVMDPHLPVHGHAVGCSVVVVEGVGARRAGRPVLGRQALGRPDAEVRGDVHAPRVQGAAR